MAVSSLEVATDGMIRTGGPYTLTMAMRGLLRVGALVAVLAENFQGFIANVGRLGRR